MQVERRFFGNCDAEFVDARGIKGRIVWALDQLDLLAEIALEEAVIICARGGQIEQLAGDGGIAGGLEDKGDGIPVSGHALSQPSYALRQAADFIGEIAAEIGT